MAIKKRLGELLIDAGVIDEAMLQSALGHQRRWGGRIGQAMLDLKLTTEPTIVQALARKLGFEVARLGALGYAFHAVPTSSGYLVVNDRHPDPVVALRLLSPKAAE